LKRLTYIDLGTRNGSRKVNLSNPRPTPIKFGKCRLLYIMYDVYNIVYLYYIKCTLCSTSNAIDADEQEKSKLNINKQLRRIFQHYLVITI